MLSRFAARAAPGRARLDTRALVRSGHAVAEPLEPAFSTATLNDAAGKKMPVPRSVGGATITLLPIGLKPGAYTVKWQAVGHDTHKLSGSFGFKVIP